MSFCAPAHLRIVLDCPVSTSSNRELVLRIPTLCGSGLEFTQRRPCLRFGRSKCSSSHCSHKFLTVQQTEVPCGSQIVLALPTAGPEEQQQPRRGCAPPREAVLTASPGSFPQTSPQSSLCGPLAAQRGCSPECPARSALSTEQALQEDCLVALFSPRFSNSLFQTFICLAPCERDRKEC